MQSGTVWHAKPSRLKEISVVACDRVEGSFDFFKSKVNVEIICTLGFKRTSMEDAHLSTLFSEGRAFPSMKKLDLSDTKITEDGVRKLARSSLVSQLTDLRLRGLQASSADFVTLMKGCSVLQRMSFSRCRNYGNECLLALSKPEELTKVSINNTAVSNDDKDKTISKLLCEKFVGLRVLRIKGNKFSGESVGDILQRVGVVEIEAPSEAKVECLLLRNERVLRARNAECKEESVYDTMQAWGTLRDETYKMIAENPIFERWEELTFKGDELTINAVKYVSSSQHAGKVERVSFECPTIEDDWIRVFLDSTNIKRLTELRIHHKISDAAIHAMLANSAKLDSLTRLDLCNTKITDEGMLAIATSKSVSNLVALNLHGTNITDKSIVALANSANCRYLKELNLQSCLGIMALASFVSTCVITTLSCVVYQHCND